MNTRVSSISERITQVMNEEGLTQADVLDLCKPFCTKYGVVITRSNISNYCTGRSQPHQIKLYILANALHVSEAWLMGYDVSRARDRNTISEAKADIDLLSKFSNLSERDQTVVRQLINVMLKVGGA